MVCIHSLQCEKLRVEAAFLPGLRAELDALRRRHSAALELMGERDEEVLLTVPAFVYRNNILDKIWCSVVECNSWTVPGLPISYKKSCSSFISL